ncbi:MAG: tripartite tricarboxylate transporter permease [Oscillospiraceae bacterium]|nr:tripartite tricarboxylate transporter permease [Oscillospiraceae bacterium]
MDGVAVEGILSVLTFESLLIMLLGTIAGVLFGAIPGLTTTMGVAIMLPITFGMSPINAMALLIAIYIAGNSGGLITAILLKIPGTPANVATTFDGAPMAENGEAGKALGTGILVSVIGTLLSVLTLIFIARPISAVALQFGPFEMFAITLFALTLISTLVGDNVLKGLMAGVAGVTLSLIGFAPIGGAARFVFIPDLSAGINMLPLLMGLFAVSEVIKMAAEGIPKNEKVANMSFKIRGFGMTLAEFKQQFVNLIRSSLIGIGVGIMPGIGSATSNVVAYSVAKSQSKYPEKFGTGIIDGIVASESSNSATLGSAMIPVLTLGIPADTVTAVMMGALMIHGVTVGPLLFETSGVFVYGIFATYIICTILLGVVMYGGMRGFVRILAVPKHILMPLVLVLCIVGAFAANFRIFDVWITLIFGIIGFLMVKFKYPMTPLIMGFVLGGILELNLVRGLSFARGSFWGFFDSNIAAFFLVASVLSVVWSVYKGVRDSRKAKAAAAANKG